MRERRLTENARSNRKAMTEPETRLWLQLRARRFGSVKFRRQKVIGPYIADFAANDPKLIIEVDGNTHDVDDLRDVARTRYLCDQGYQVIRFTNLDVMQNMAGVLTRVAETIEALGSAPLPTLSPEGERVR